MSLFSSPLVYTRVVSSDDLVPWMMDNEFSEKNPVEQRRHAAGVNEIWMPDPYHYGIKVCTWEERSQCSASVDCSKRNWNHHLWYGGFFGGRRFCIKSAVPQTRL